jgi:hypothetical protein
MSQFKIECARRQLGTALDLYLRDLDPVSVHCLANGACELIEFYVKKAGAEPLVSHILQTQPHLDIEVIKRMQRKYWNAFKHATTRGGEERQDDELLSMFTDQENDAALFVGWVDYGRATKMMPIEAQIHHMWWITLNPDKVEPTYPMTEYDKRFPRLREMPRAEHRPAENSEPAAMQEIDLHSIQRCIHSLIVQTMWSPAAIKSTARKAIELKRARQASGSASKMGRCISHVLGRIAAPNNHPDAQSFRKMERWPRVERTRL